MKKFRTRNEEITESTEIKKKKSHKARPLEDLQDKIMYINGTFTTVKVIEAKKGKSLCLIIRASESSKYYNSVGKTVPLHNGNLYPEQRRFINHNNFREIKDY